MWFILALAVVGSIAYTKKMQRDMEDAQAGLLVQRSGGSNSLPVIYGKRRINRETVWQDISYSRIPELTSNSDSYFERSTETSYQVTRDDEDYLHRLDVWCLGPVHEISDFEVDGDKATHTRFANAKNSRPLLRFFSKHGNSSQSMFPALESAYSDITSDMKGNDVAYSWSRFLYIAPEPDFQGEPDVTAEIKGIEVWDPRINPSDPTDPLSRTWSDNPALCLLDYLLAYYGRNLRLSDIHLDSFIVAANKCDTALETLPDAPTVPNGVNLFYDPSIGEFVPVTTGDDYPYYREGQASGSAKRFKCDIILQSTDSTRSNVEEILKTMRGSLPFTAGQYKLVLEDVGTPVMTFDDTNIIGGVEIGYGDRSKRYNRVTVKFPNQNKSYKPDTLSFPEENSTEHLTMKAEDQGEDLHTTVELTGTTDYYTARDLAEYIVKESRTQQYVQFKAQGSAIALEIGDIITVSTSALDFEAKPFIVRSLSVGSDLIVDINAQQYDENIYPWGVTDPEPVVEQAPTVIPPALNPYVEGLINSNSNPSLDQVNTTGNVVASLTVNRVANGTVSSTVEWALIKNSSPPDQLATNPWPHDVHLKRDGTIIKTWTIDGFWLGGAGGDPYFVGGGVTSTFIDTDTGSGSAVYSVEAGSLDVNYFTITSQLQTNTST